jgi:hypothetical protein
LDASNPSGFALKNNDTTTSAFMNKFKIRHVFLVLAIQQNITAVSGISMKLQLLVILKGIKY